MTKVNPGQRSLKEQVNFLTEKNFFSFAITHADNHLIFTLKPRVRVTSIGTAVRDDKHIQSLMLINHLTLKSKVTATLTMVCNTSSHNNAYMLKISR